jgi:hypothetical protein
MKKSLLKVKSLKNNSALSASFRDPSGFVFKGSDNQIYRQINNSAKSDFDSFIKSGLYKTLAEKKMIVSHQATTQQPLLGEAYKIIKPQQIEFISYPFEWSFSQLKDAALLTLSIQRMALQKGMNLKDASAYNIQYEKGKPIFIDTLSFEKYQKDKPWDGYRQFCQHFLAPLSLMTYSDIALNELSRIFIDGIPLGLAGKLLPTRAKLKPGLAMHLFLHAKAQKSKAQQSTKPKTKLPKKNLLAIISSLESTINNLKPPKINSEWGDYYDHTNYTKSAAGRKAQCVLDYLKTQNIKTALDLGGNNGRFSRVLNEIGIFTVCADIDPKAVEANYRHVKKHQEEMMLPLLIDLNNPGGGLGWANNERLLFDRRIKTDVTLALALIHHLAISNNLPFDKIASYFAKFSELLVIEFVPKSDSQVKRLLATRKDIFPFYDESNFKKAFGLYYTLQQETKIEGTERTLYLFKRK